MIEKKLSYKLLLLTVLFSTFITVFITVVELYIEYKNGINLINKQFDSVINSHQDSLEKGIWVYDTDQINSQLKGIVSLPDIVYTSIKLEDGTLYKYGTIQDKNVIEKKFKLIYNKDIYLGELNIIADVNGLYDELINKILIILFLQGIKTFFVSFFILYLFQILVTKHLEKISSYTNNLSFNKKNKPLILEKAIFKNKNDELDSLVDSINTMETELYNSFEEAKNHERVLQEQSKMAAMGEMIANIAHQWKQPLSGITMSTSGIEVEQEFNTLTDEKLAVALNNINKSVWYMSETIDDFRNFYSNNKVIEEFDLEHILKRTLNLGKSKYKLIEVVTNIEPIKITGIANELVQVLLNILNNASDALNEKEVKNQIVLINIYNKETSVIIDIQDNAGGIADNVISKIFDSRFTTKSKDKGTGIGLYMSKNIIQNSFNGKIEVQNNTFEYNNHQYKGALFRITL